MIARGETTTENPLFGILAKTLKEKGADSRTISTSEFKDLMMAVVNDLLSGQSKVDLSIKNMNVEVSNSVASIVANVELIKPVKATISINLSLGNLSQNQLMLKGITTNIEAGFLQKKVVQAFNIESQTRTFLSNPNAKLHKVLSEKLSGKGVKLNPNLGVNISGSQITLIMKNDSYRAEPAAPVFIEEPAAEPEELPEFELQLEPLEERVYELDDTQPTRTIRRKPAAEPEELPEFELQLEPLEERKVVAPEDEKPAKPVLKKDRFA